MNYINLGCGNRFLEEWKNIDFFSNSPYVTPHNLVEGIPFEDEFADVVYHSHVLEHFNKEDGKRFLQECYRVLKPNGVIRIVVPDLEQIARQYLLSLEKANAGDKAAELNYDWSMIELYDQTVRDCKGGMAAKYLSRDYIENEEYIYSRWGQEAKALRESFLKHKFIVKQKRSLRVQIGRFFNLQTYKNKIVEYLLGDDIRALKLGKFRLSGEVHQWMYDRYSLNTLLKEVGFTIVEVKSPFCSFIPNWPLYQQLDVEGGVARKPDSLFIEAIK